MSFAWLSRFALVLACLGVGGCFPPPQAKLDENKNPYLLEGKARAAARDYKGAIDAFEKALEVHPRSALAHFELGMLYEQHSDQTEKDYINAMYHYQQVISESRIARAGVLCHGARAPPLETGKSGLARATGSLPVPNRARGPSAGGSRSGGFRRLGKSRAGTSGCRPGL
jgi:tetratricopeptide (TPR) repeat protein